MAIDTDADELHRFLSDHAPVWVLTGAGISLESGIPTYRDESGQWQRSDPIKHQEFMQQERKRKRYWARSMVGWKEFERAEPNLAHQSLAGMQRSGLVGTIVTQNVDGLHQKAGSQEVIDLHGRLDSVICMDCSTPVHRSVIQTRLEANNPQLTDFAAQILPDGDALIDEFSTDSFTIPVCEYCGGTLKPDVVFFGDTVPRSRVDRAMNTLEASSAVLVIGSSLQVMSGFRFCRRADVLGIPIASINPGITRADHLLKHRWRQPSETLLSDAYRKAS